MIPGPYRNIALIGFMGSGKSTLAGQLAERLGWDVADSDAEVEREAGKPIPRIFLEDGEAAFRELEERAVARLSERMDAVIALGGGAITSPVTRERLRDGSFTVLLDVSVQTAWRRIEAEAEDRPLAVEARGFADLYEQRRPLYHAAADALVDAEQLEGGEPLLVPLSRPGRAGRAAAAGGRAARRPDRRPGGAAAGGRAGGAAGDGAAARRRGGQDGGGGAPGVDAAGRPGPGAR